ncbi:hypothetical protein SAMN05428969_0444 [Devosia sp. YR412]|uniref:hypothetical protein n=1 Tax=Devosia sp. YR412 TaxID=1881030 RepID=UPI0008B12F07|nr:hypothetical protein [Devosia sp. YR412]SEP68307.1 hypothetical protein SAMN05428969_0444 [Devosia sp. YR412]
MSKQEPVVPLEFDPRVTDDEADYLKFSEVAGGQIVTWPAVGESLFVPTFKWWPDLDAITVANGSRFVCHGAVGFSLGRYHEFVIEPMLWENGEHHPSMLAANLGGVEITFGDPSPLIAFLLEGPRDKHVGAWSDFSTVRILGVDTSVGEAAFLNACRWHYEVTGVWPLLLPVDMEWGELPAVPKSGEVASGPPMLSNVEPLRFLYSAMTQKDDTAACVYLYKIIEYFGFFSSAAQMSSLRHDHSISNFDFSKKVLELVFKDEKGPIIKLVHDLADATILSAAAENGLPSESGHKLADAMYSFRNSIVHGKYSYGFTLQAASVLQVDTLARTWRPILLALAQGAIRKFGTPLST